MERLVNYIFVGLLTLAYVSCSESSWNELGEYKKETIKINPGMISGQLKKERYNVDSVCSLSLPEGMELREITKFTVKNNRIYIMDSRLGKTIFVFNNTGRFLFKAGERGRAKNEYIDGPTDFFVDNDGNIHVFDGHAKKIMIFDNTGKVKNVINTMHYFPHSIGMKANNKYMFDFNYDKDEENTVLAEYDENNITNKLIHRKDKYFYDIGQTFYANDSRLSHIPLMADSVIIFSGDTLEKVVKFDFNGKFIMQESPSLILELHNPEEISAYKGVRALLSYQETDKLILLQYVYQSRITYWLQDKDTKKVISGPFLFDGLSPFTNYFIKGNQIISIVTNEGMPTDKNYFEKKGDTFKTNYNKSPKQLQDIYDGKTKLPVVVFISIK